MLRNISNFLFSERSFSTTYTFVAFRHIECISGVLKIDFSTFGDHSLSSILDGVFHTIILGIEFKN